MKIHLTKFVQRQTPDSQYSHWFSNDDLLEQVNANFDKHKPGYRDGVILVPISPEGVCSGVVQLYSGDKLTGVFRERKEGEEPRKSIWAAHSSKVPAKSAYVVLYRHDVLVETGENETDADWEIISVNASPTEDDPPIMPDVLIANHFQLSGGTATNMTNEEFVKQLKESVFYWKDKALATPIGT